MPGLPMERREPGYSLEVVQSAFAVGQFRVTNRVLTYFSRVGWSRRTVRSCVSSLTPADFFKAQRHIDRPDAWLDIYKPLWMGERLYMKVTLLENGCEFLVLSFCRDGDQH
jgi:hypothetical protein